VERKAPREAALDEGLKSPAGGEIMVEDIKPGSTGTRRTKSVVRTASVDVNGTEENIPFRDLPGIRFDERTLTRATTVGHDALIEKELKRLLGEFGDDSNKVDAIFLNEVKLYVKAFQTNDQYRRFMNSSLKRSARYMPTVKEVFKKRNIPEDMAFIAFLESGFNPNARSHAGAVGMWQFMSGTAKRYSLTVGGGVDERLDPVKSTFAAVEYFHDLIAIFGPRSFLLALAAYNAGEGRIIGCLKKIDNPMEERTFWHIRTCLAKETREYPPKIIAAAVIGSNPEVFGFPRYEGNGESVEVRTAFSTFKSPEESRPEVRVSSRPEPARKIGVGGKTVVPAASRKAKAPEPAKPIIYVVKKDNTLATVADIFKVEKEDIKKWNKLKTPRVAAGMKLRIYPSPNMERVSYKVKKGDTITEICQTFKVRPATLIASNGLKNGWTIKQGQILVVYRIKGKTAYRA
jgi:membrane-bound lytic murein transglycosylase D